jgi:hypothetical protein
MMAGQTAIVHNVLGNDFYLIFLKNSRNLKFICGFLPVVADVYFSPADPCFRVRAITVEAGYIYRRPGAHAT